MTAVKKKPSATRKKAVKKTASASSGSFMGRAKTFIIGYTFGAASLAIVNAAGGFSVLIDKALQAGDQGQSVAQVSDTKPSGAKQDDKPVFEFYDELKTATVAVDVEPEVGAERQQFDYFLQVASFRNLDDADRLRATLILEGVDVDLKQVNTQKNGKWYRLMAGPFANRSKMAAVRGKLATHELSPIVLKQPKG